MKSFVIGIACALLLVSFVPLVRAQEEQPAEQPPIIPPELAEGISEMGMGPIISFVLAGLAFVGALVVDMIDTVIALVAAVWAAFADISIINYAFQTFKIIIFAIIPGAGLLHILGDILNIFYIGRVPRAVVQLVLLWFNFFIKLFQHIVPIL